MSLIHRDQGSTIIATMLVLLALLALGTAMLRMAVHSNDSTSMDREHAQAFQAAEAGAHKAIGMLPTSANCTGASIIEAQDLYDRDRLVGSYVVDVSQLSSTMCLVESTGSAATGQERSERKIEVEVRRLPQAVPSGTFAVDPITWREVDPN